MAFKEYNPISAGFGDIKANTVECFGESVGLKLKSDPNDTELLKKELDKY